jgi:AraC-like DNA-binding protein
MKAYSRHQTQVLQPQERTIREFAKASIVNLILHRLRETDPGLVPQGACTVDAIRRSTVPAEHKKAILERIWRDAGPLVLLSIGQGIRSVAYDPVWRAALRTPDPMVVFDKWRRFEVFGHSRNRLMIKPSGDRRVAFERYTVDGGKPAAPENLLICGLIIGLLEEIGSTGLRCDMPLGDGSRHCLRTGGQFSLPKVPGSLVTTSWTIEWDRFDFRALPSEAGAAPPEIALPPSCSPAVLSLVDRVLQLLAFDVARRWDIGELAAELAMSKRTLQRMLGRAELSFSQLVRLVRIHEACRLLEHTSTPVTAIGFCSGFSDSAQFSKEFRASIGMTPSEYRDICQQKLDACPV